MPTCPVNTAPAVRDPRVIWGQSIPADAPVVGVNERCIEVPLGLEVARLDLPGRVLDAGCGLNGQLWATMRASVYHVTLQVASEMAYAHTTRPLSYLSADLRDLGMFTDRAFDATVCISTLEHIGLDNTVYGGLVETRPETMLKAFKELCRVTDRRVFVTVPYADPPVCHRDWRFFGPAAIGALTRMAERFYYQVERRFYAKTEGGWQGGGEIPIEASLDGFPETVNAIACVRCTR